MCQSDPQSERLEDFERILNLEGDISEANKNFKKLEETVQTIPDDMRSMARHLKVIHKSYRYGTEKDARNRKVRLPSRP